MTRQLALALVAACLCAGCAAPRHAETDVLVSRIIDERSSNLACPVNDARYCEAEVDGRLRCACVPAHQLMQSLRGQR